MSENINDIDVKVAECRGDFWNKLEEALVQCHGDPRHVFERAWLAGKFGTDPDDEKFQCYADMPLRRVCDILAQNGVRMTWSPEWTLEPQIYGAPEGSITTTERTT